MINALIGKIVSVKPQEIVLRVGGIEFSLIVSSQTSSRLSSLTGAEKEETRVFTVLSHREDSMLLYGFSEELEKEAFTQLQSVGGIGPKQALKILSGISVGNLARALDENNLKLLSSIPGVGPKTAQKMILQLRGQLVLEEEAFTKQRRENPKFREVVTGLVDMGYDRRSCEEVVAKIESERKEELSSLSLRDQEELVFKEALRSLG